MPPCAPHRLLAWLVAALATTIPIHAFEGVSVSPYRLPHDADVAWRWILELDDPVDLATLTNLADVCPASGSASWSRRLLFDLGSGPTGVPIELRRYCVYETNVVPADPSPLTALATYGTLGADRIVVVPQASNLAETLAPALEQRFLAAAGHVPLPMGTGSRSPRLALLDTLPTDAQDPANLTTRSGHGHALAHFAERLLCGSQGCLADITTQLALPYFGFDPESLLLSQSYFDATLGGYLGTLTDLAVALHGELEAWRIDDDAGPLITTLALGWDPRFCAPSGSTSSATTTVPCDPNVSIPAVRAVHTALQEVACHGGLIIAAAGNRMGGPDQHAHGALLPAAWEALPAPESAQCAPFIALRSLGPDRPIPTKAAGNHQPLLYAAAGLADKTRLLSNARAHSMPPRAAFADHAVVTLPGGTTTATLTGSSVAALVVASTAAAVWHYRPGLLAHEVMALIYDAGRPLHLPGVGPRLADLPSIGGPPQPAHAIRVCAAARRACDVGESDVCPPPTAIPDCPTDDAPNPDFGSFTGMAGEIDLTTFDSHGIRPECDGRMVFVDPAIPESELDDPILCPASQYHSLNATPYVGPQPEEKPCAACSSSCCSHETEIATVDTKDSRSGALKIEVEGRTAVLRLEIAGHAPTLCAPTLTFGHQSFRIHSGNWPCSKAGDQCEIRVTPFDPGFGPIEVAYAVVEDGQTCDTPGIPRWSLSDELVAWP